MRYCRILFPLLATAVLLSSCGRNTVKISSFAPNGEVEQFTTFTVEFNKDLASSDILGEWQTDEYITFNPKISGKYKWASANTLIFSPDNPLAPAQDYTAKVTDKVLFQTKYHGSFKTQKFHSPYFNIKKVDFFWTQVRKTDYKVVPQANVYFNYDVDPEQLKKYLEVKLGNSPMNNFKIVSDKPANVIAVDFGEVKQTDDYQTFTIIFKKGLGSTVTNKPLEENREFKVNLAPLAKLAVNNVTSGYDADNEKGWVEIFTSQMVDEDFLKDYVNMEPDIDMDFIVNPESFRIESKNFEPGESLNLKLKKGLPGLFGGTLEFEYTQKVLLADVRPSIRFTNNREKYMMLSGTKNMKVDVVNVKEANVEVYEIFRNNLIFFLNNNWRFSSSYDYDYYNSDYGYDGYVYDYGKSLYSEKITLKNLKNKKESFIVNMQRALDQRFQGIYMIRVNSDQDYWLRDSKIVSISDMGMIAKYSSDELLVFVNSIATAEPVEGATVSLISTNNQEILKGKTDGKGVIKFSNIKPMTEGFNGRIIIAELGNDFNYLDLREAFVETSRYEVGGKTVYSDMYETFIYSDRNIYRPGETAYLSSIVRTKKMEPVKDLSADKAGIPVVVKIISPTGKKFGEYKKTLNEEGSFELAVSLPEYALTGEYSADVYSGSEQMLGSYKFSVEEFVPDKIKVNLKQDKKSLKPGEKLTVSVEALNLFGPPAANRDYEMDVVLQHYPFVSKNFPKYNFSSSSINQTSIENDFQNGTLDENGKAELTYEVSKDVMGPGVLKGNANVTVFDVTGRTVTRSAEFTVYPKDYFVGIQSNAYYMGVNEKITMNLIAVNENDQAIANFPAEVELIRYEWKTVLKRNYNDYYYYDSEKEEISEWTKPVTIPAAGLAYTFVVPQSGEYQLRVHKQGSDDYVYRGFYAYGWGSSSISSFKVNREGNIDITLDKESYQPGERAKILFKTPFSGKMLVTVERDEVYNYYYVDVKKNSAELEIPLPNEYMPNVYVSATLFRPHKQQSETPLLVGHGYAPLKVEKKSNKLNVSIVAPKKIKPRTTQDIIVKTNPESDIYVTLAAVDEGILQVKNFKTPDPYGFMYAKLALRTNSYDLYKFLLPEIKSRTSPAGGDEEMAKKHMNPISVQRFKLVAFWSGILHTNSNGEVKVPLKIPQFNGDIRLMAVAYSGPRFGSAEEHMKVADDVVITPALPRFLAPNDSIAVPVSVMNTTDKPGNITVKIKVSGPLKVSSSSSQTIRVDANSETRVMFGITAQDYVGVAKISFETSGMYVTSDEIEIGVRPVSPFVTETGAGSIKGGENVTITVPSNFIPQTQNTSITISKFPAVKLAEHMKYLIGYPHGCIEQTVSKLFPQLYFDELAAVVAPDMYKNGNPVYYIKEGIRKLESMQRYDGAMQYWPGWDYGASWWGSAYAAHFLVEAEKKGYEVSDDVMRNLLNYLNEEAKSKDLYDYVEYRWNGAYYEAKTIHQIASKEILYSLYVLALAKKPDIATMNYYKSRPELLTNDTKYLLAGAFGFAGNWNAYHDLMPSTFMPEKTDRLTGGSFDSEIRANAIMLNVLLEVDPSNNQVPYIVKHLSQIADHFYSTQDRSWAFLALGKAASKNADAKVTVNIQTNGKTMKTFTGNNLVFSSKDLNGKTVTLSSSGSGTVYYFWNTEGIKVNEKVKEEDSFIRARRTFYDRNGKEITNNTFYQNQLIVCRISLGTTRTAENIAISDLLPAGFEIENPRLNQSTDLPWIAEMKKKKSGSAEERNYDEYYDEYSYDYDNYDAAENPYMDIRDDRLLIFTNVNARKTNEYFYMVRVVTQGKFELPALGAEAMYDPELHSYHGGKKIRVLPMPKGGSL